MNSSFFKKKLCLAPMANVNSATFRYVCKKNGCDIIYSAMLHVENLIHNDFILKKMNFSKKDKPLIIQLVGNKKESFVKAINIVDKYCDYIDINFGCPDSKIIEAKSGSYFLKDLSKMKDLLSYVTSKTGKNITVKTRLGFNKINTKKIISAINDYDISAVALHGRTVKQGFSDDVNYVEINKAKELAKMPLIANGDITEKNAKEIYEFTNVDSLMIGRRVMVNPNVFNLIKNELFNKNKKSLSQIELLKQYVKYYPKLEEIYDLNDYKQHLCWFLSGIQNAAKYRNAIMNLTSIELINDYINTFS